VTGNNFVSLQLISPKGSLINLKNITLMLKNSLLLVLFSSLLFMNGSCIKDGACKNKSIDSERSTILAYAATQGLTVTEDPSGIFYYIVNPGTGASPTASSTVRVNYVGRLTTGTIFVQTTNPVNIALSQVIKGWQYGLPLIKAGGTLRLLVPSSLGYGCTGFGTVPENSILDFSIDLIAVY